MVIQKYKNVTRLFWSIGVYFFSPNQITVHSSRYFLMIIKYVSEAFFLQWIYWVSLSGQLFLVYFIYTNREEVEVLQRQGDALMIAKQAGLP